MCAAIPVIKMLRESLVVTNVHRVLGIVNGTTNFILTQMEAGADYGEAVADAKRLGYAEADPTEDLSGADAAAKVAILATVAFGSRVTLDDVRFEGIERIRPEHMQTARDLGATVRLIAAAPWSTAPSTRVSSRRWSIATPTGFGPWRIQRSHAPGRCHPRDHRGGAGRGRCRDCVSRRGRPGQHPRHAGTGFLQNDACWRVLDLTPSGRATVTDVPPYRGGRPARCARSRGREVGRGRGFDRPPHPASTPGWGLTRHRHTRGSRVAWKQPWPRSRHSTRFTRRPDVLLVIPEN